MISLALYKVLHLVGVLLLLSSLGGIAGTYATGGASASPRLFKIAHGLALAVILVAGFGLLAKLSLASPGAWPLWVWIKIAVWLVLGGSVVALRKADRTAGSVALVLVVVAAVAAWAAVVKPAL